MLSFLLELQIQKNSSITIYIYFLIIWPIKDRSLPTSPLKERKKILPFLRFYCEFHVFQISFFLFAGNDKTSKKPSHRLNCAACKMIYDDVIAKKENMFISSVCSHVFCAPCISRDEKSKVCPACEIKLVDFCRLYV